MTSGQDVNLDALTDDQLRKWAATLREKAGRLMDQAYRLDHYREVREAEREIPTPEKCKCEPACGKVLECRRCYRCLPHDFVLDAGDCDLCEACERIMAREEAAIMERSKNPAGDSGMPF